MGCSSSALNKASDSSRSRSATSNECSPNTEDSEFSFAQPKPRTARREAALHSQTPPHTPLKTSGAPAANGLQPLGEQPPAAGATPGEDAADQAGSTKITRPPGTAGGSGPPQWSGKDDTGPAEEKKDMGGEREAQTLKALGTDSKGQALRTAGDQDSPGALDGTQNPHAAAGEAGLEGTAEHSPSLPTGAELQPPEALGRGESAQLLKTIPREKEAPETVEASQLAEAAREQQLQETPGQSEQSHFLEPLSGESVALNVSQPTESPVVNASDRTTPESPDELEQVQPEGVAGSTEQPAGVVETEVNEETVGKTPIHREEQHVEGETGEQVETGLQSEKASERAEAKEETRDLVYLSAAT
ncbi:glutamate-rich protein 5 [Ochotona princeps]|uniref:glutamate-rich protein 5 n=1 Tax=Ochotona princeps TaxID=9978 RepID=UPI00271454D3|nr:glutamate-rich protein 5 [Ochotona princeps]